MEVTKSKEEGEAPEPLFESMCACGGDCPIRTDGREWPVASFQDWCI